MSGTTMMLYHYFRKFDGNVCMDWRLTSDLSTSLQTTDGKTARVNSQAFEQFLNPKFKGSEAGSCQEAGYENKQLKFSAYVKPPAAASLVQPIL